MPRVSPAHVEARRHQILEAARICFLCEGFHETSMQDIIREAGLSTGAVYLYFKSKDDLITTLATDRLQVVAEGLEHLLHGEELPPLEQVPARLIRAFLQADGDMGFEQLAIQIIAESQHNPAIREMTSAVIAMMLGRVERAVAVYQARGLVDPAIPAAAIARVVAAVVHGFLVQRSLDPAFDPERFLAGLPAFQARPA